MEENKTPPTPPEQPTVPTPTPSAANISGDKPIGAGGILDSKKKRVTAWISAIAGALLLIFGILFGYVVYIGAFLAAYGFIVGLKLKSTPLTILSGIGLLGFMVMLILLLIGNVT